MDGVTDAPFRYITDIYGKPDIIYTEFVSVKGLIIGKPAIQRMLLRHQTETKTIAQFFGCEPEYFYQAALVALKKVLMVLILTWVVRIKVSFTGELGPV